MFRVGIEDDSAETYWRNLRITDVIDSVTVEWQEVNIPLAQLTDGNNNQEVKVSRLEQLFIEVSSYNLNSREGVIYLDNITFKWSNDEQD